MGDNPFVYGEIVTAAAFADREDERERLGRDLASGQKVFLISPRRYGKSSLVRDVHARPGAPEDPDHRGHGRGVQLVRRLPRVLRPGAGRRRYAGRPPEALDRRPARRDQARRSASTPTRAAARKFTLGFPAVRTARDTARLAAEVFALPARIAEARKQRLAIALDEFQAITAFDGGTVENALRAAVQDQRQVGYVFSGSEPSLMERMLGPRRPFYKAGPVMRLEKIDPDEFADVHRRAVPRQRHPSRRRTRRSHRRSGRQRAVRRAAPRARNLGRRAGKAAGRRPASTICMRP